MKEGYGVRNKPIQDWIGKRNNMNSFIIENARDVDLFYESLQLLNRAWVLTVNHPDNGIFEQSHHRQLLDRRETSSLFQGMQKQSRRELPIPDAKEGWTPVTFSTIYTEPTRVMQRLATVAAKSSPSPCPNESEDRQ